MRLNYNNAIQTSFLLSIPEVPTLNFAVQSTNMPSINLNAIETKYQDVRAKIPDNVYVWDDLSVTLLMDEDFYAHELLTEWMKAAREKKEWTKPLKDIRIELLDSNKNSNFSFLFKGAWPNNITGWSMMSNTAASDIVTFDVMFSFQDLQLVRDVPLEFKIAG